MTAPTARDRLFVELTGPTEWDADVFGLPESKAGALLDAYRDQVLAEAAQLVTSTSLARLDAIDEDDQRPSDWEQHQEWCAAAVVLLAARTAPTATA
jgi:hypothetical protein